MKVIIAHQGIYIFESWGRGDKTGKATVEGPEEKWGNDLGCALYIFLTQCKLANMML